MVFKGMKLDKFIKDTSVDREDVQACYPRADHFRSPGLEGREAASGQTKWQVGTEPLELEGPDKREEEEGWRKFQERVWGMKFGLCCRGL